MSSQELSQVSFEELLSRARAGQASAFNELFRRSRPTLDKWASRRRASAAPQAARPSDISQEISELALRGFSSFRGSTAGEWFTWLKSIFRNGRLAAHRQEHALKREPAGLLSLDSEEASEAPSPGKSLSQATVHRDECHRLYVCIYELAADQKEALCLHHLKDLPVAEVARRMKKTESAVTGLLYRGWAQVKARMQDEPAPEQLHATAPLDEAAAAFMVYLRSCDAGRVMDAEAFIADYPQCEDRLRDMIHWIDRLRAYRPVPTAK